MVFNIFTFHVKRKGVIIISGDFMAYKALYRTYRPSTFKEVAGQKHIVKTLENALNTQKIAHAYLFTGPRGTGKTTMAKLVAKALNCEEGIGHQCNQCSNCLAINNGSHPDVIEIDAASNNGVDDVRDIIERVKYSPMKGRYKVYIIDEVHMMSASAFNALLKTLEEPPAHVIFILATTEPHKVLPTILSRCQRYDFTKVDETSIEERMKEILLKEKISYDEDALKLIISLADGGVRDALSLLDQSIAYAGDYLHLHDLEELFGLAGNKEKMALLISIAHANYKEVLETMNQFLEHGVDIRRLTSDLLNILKDALIYQKTKDVSLLITLKEEDAKTLEKEISSLATSKMIDILLALQSEFKAVNNIRSLFEITLLKLCAVHEEVEKVEQSNSSSLPLKEQPFKQAPTSSSERKEEKQPTILKEEPKETPVVQEKKEKKDEVPPFLMPKPEITFEPIEEEGEKNSLSDETMIQIMVSGNKEEKQKLIAIWPQLQTFLLDPKLGKYASLLQDGAPYILAKEVLVLQYELPSLVDKVNVTTHQKFLKDVIEKLIHRKVSVYAIVRTEAVRLYGKYQNLYQVGKLPHIGDFELNIQF